MSTDELTQLLQRVDENVALHSRLVAYYEGRQPLTYLAPEVRASLSNRLHSVSVNIPRLLVDSIAERLRVIGFTDPQVWRDWVANDLDTMAGTCHRESLMLGDAYAIVWAHPDGRPKVTIESATQMAVATDPATREVLSAVKRWETPQGTHAVLYGPDTVTHYVAPSVGATTGFRAVETLRNPLGVPPVVRFRNGDRLTTAGISEMLDVLPLTDALVKLTTDLLAASEYAARPRRWATGIELAQDAEGNTINPIPEANRSLITENPDAKFGQLPGADLVGYENAIGVIMRSISAVSGLPEHMLGIGGDNPTSADSIRASEAALTAKAEARQAMFGKAWGQVARLMLAVRRGVDPAGIDVAVKWADASTRSVAAEADAVTKLFAAGLLPASYALRRLGYTEDEVEVIRAARRTEALDAAGTQLGNLLP